MALGHASSFLGVQRRVEQDNPKVMGSHQEHGNCSHYQDSGRGIEAGLQKAGELVTIGQDWTRTLEGPSPCTPKPADQSAFRPDRCSLV